jgi:hypothetical protein
MCWRIGSPSPCMLVVLGALRCNVRGGRSVADAEAFLLALRA